MTAIDYGVAPFGDEGAPWDIKALTALWRDTERPEITLQKSPALGACYDLQISDALVKAGDLINVLFEPALAYLNGFDSVEDIEGTAIMHGVVTQADPKNYTKDTYFGQLQDIKFTVTSSTPFRDFQNQDLKVINNEHWGDFYDEYQIVGINRYNEYIRVYGSEDSYLSNECIFIRNMTGFQLLYLSGYIFAQPNWVRAGNLKTPELFSKRLTERLSAMGDEMYWHGEKL